MNKKISDAEIRIQQKKICNIILNKCWQWVNCNECFYDTHSPITDTIRENITKEFKNES